MGPSLSGYRWVARASLNRAPSCQVSLLRDGEHVWSWFQAADTTSQAAVTTETEAAQLHLGPLGSIELGENYASAAILSQAALGLRSVPRAQFPFAECSSSKRVLGRLEARLYVCPSLAGYGWVAWATANRASSCQISLLREGQHVRSWFQAADTTSPAAVPMEPEVAQPLLGPLGSIGLGEN